MLSETLSLYPTPPLVTISVDLISLMISALNFQSDAYVVCLGGPLLLMELAFLLRGVGAEVVWITYQKPAEPDEVVYSLENKMLDRGVQVRQLYLSTCFP